MIPVKHIDPNDLVLYAMQLLPQEEMNEMALHLQYSAEARKVLSEIYSDLAIFAHSAEMHSPPAQTRQRLMKHVAREKKALPASLAEDSYAPRGGITLMEEPVKRGLAARTLPWLGWAIAAGMLFEVGNLYQQRENLKSTVASSRTQLSQSTLSAEVSQTLMDTVKDPSAVHIVLTGSDVKPPAEGRASYVAEKGSLLFMASNLEPLQAYKTYELWLIPSDGRDPIPAGTFRPDQHGNATVILPELPKGVQAKAFGVTIEDGEGSPQPTLPIILKGVAS